MLRAKAIALVGMVVALLVAGAGTATAQQTPQTEVEIFPVADFDSAAMVEVGLRVRCEGGTGTVQVTVTQEPPESTAPSIGTQMKAVVCDGKPHEVAVNVTGGPAFDAGRAFAVATLEAPSGTDEDEKFITIDVR